MSFGDYILIFTGAFVSVFLLGLQSRNVNNGRYTAAVITSFGISLAQFVFVKYAATGQYVVLAVSATGGCIGIACSIWFYQTFMYRYRNE